MQVRILLEYWKIPQGFKDQPPGLKIEQKFYLHGQICYPINSL